MNRLTRGAIEILRAKLNSLDYKRRSRKSKRNFTRKSRLDFKTMLTMIMRLVKRSMQIELNEVFDELEKETMVSKQAFSQARKKIRPEAIQELYEDTVQSAVESDELRYFKDEYRVLAADGTTVPLENNKELTEHFGYSGGSETACTGRVSVLQDVYHGILYDAIMSPYNEGERMLAMRHIKKLDELDDRENIILFDRGYVSKELIAECCELGHYFVMRIRDRWHTKLIESTKSGEWASIKHDKKEYRVRIIKIILENGDQEVLFTNIDFLDVNDFYDLYGLRWTVETRYDTIKNIIQLENTSGLTVDSVLQDFWACMAVSNILAFVKVGADDVIRLQNEGKNLTRQYHASNAIIMGTLRRYFVRMVVLDDDQIRDEYAKKFFDAIVRFSDVVQPKGRSFPRPKKRKRSNFSLRKKSVL